MNNSIFVIRPYYFAGTWVIDSPEKFLNKEPFVSGVPEILDDAVKDIPNAKDGFRLLFSTSPFPNYSVKLTWLRSEGEGNWYRDETTGKEGWLCACLGLWFSDPPQNLYAKAEPIQ